MSSRTPPFLYFDLGGVLVDLDLDAMRREWEYCTGTSGTSLDRAFFATGLKERFDRGLIAQDALVRTLSATTGASLSTELFSQIWAHVLKPRPKAPEWIATASRWARCGLLSNTDPVHLAVFESQVAGWPAERRWEDRVVVTSFGTGHVKPEPGIYAHAEDSAGVPADRIAFLDDTLANVDAARARGWMAFHCPDVATLESALDRLSSTYWERPEEASI